MNIYYKSLKKLIKFKFPENTEIEFDNILWYLLELYLGHYGYHKFKTKGSIYKYNNYVDFELPDDVRYLFKFYKKRLNLFARPSSLLSLTKSLHDTIDEILNHDTIMQQFFIEEMNGIKHEIVYKALSDYNSIRETTKKNNHKLRGEYYLEHNFFNPSLLNMNKICLVHATNFYPKKNAKGKYFIETTAKATEFLKPRPTIHFSCNHIVESHLYGTWDSMPYIILAPITDMIELNGKPRRFGVVDTYFLPDQNRGIELPESVMIVEPSTHLPKNKLFQIAPNNHAYYRVNDFDTNMIDKLLRHRDERIDKMSQEEKNAFLSNLSKKLATIEIMDQNGFCYITSECIQENLTILSDYERTGKENGLESNGDKYVHVNDQATWLHGKYDNVPGLIRDAETKTRTLENYELDILQCWLEEHVLQDKPIKTMTISDSDPQQIQETKNRYNTATAKLLNRLKQELRTQEDVVTYVRKINNEHD